MAEVAPQGPTQAQVASMIAAAIAGLPTNFVGGGSPMTLDALYTNYPPGASYNGLYARVSNLFNGTSTTAAGGIDDVVRCRFDAANSLYRWVPQREAWNLPVAGTSGTINLIPLVTPPSVRLTGTLIGNMQVQPSAANAYIGQRFTVIQASVLGVFTTTIIGLIGSNLTLLGNTTQQLEYTAAGWSKSTP